MGDRVEHTGEQKEQESLQDHLSMWTCTRGIIMKLLRFGGLILVELLSWLNFRTKVKNRLPLSRWRRMYFTISGNSSTTSPRNLRVERTPLKRLDKTWVSLPVSFKECFGFDSPVLEVMEVHLKSSQNFFPLNFYFCCCFIPISNLEFQYSTWMNNLLKEEKILNTRETPSSTRASLPVFGWSCYRSSCSLTTSVRSPDDTRPYVPKIPVRSEEELSMVPGVVRNPHKRTMVLVHGRQFRVSLSNWTRSRSPKWHRKSENDQTPGVTIILSTWEQSHNKIHDGSPYWWGR